MPLRPLNAPPALRPAPGAAGAPKPSADESPAPSASPILFAAPHRAMFLSGVVLLLLSFALWGLELLARAGLAPALPWGLPPGAMHAMLVLAGAFPLFMFGFLLTAMPRWQGAGDLPAATWLWSWRLLAGGWGVALIGVFAKPLLVPGLALVLAGWAGVLRVLHRLAFNGHPDATHARLALGGIAAGALGLVAWGIFAALGDGMWARMAIEIGIWWFMLPVFFTVCHRMVPFFSGNVIPNYVLVRPQWTLGVIIGGSVLHGVLAMTGLQAFAWLVDAPMAAVALWLTVRWRLLPAMKVPLLGMLHIGFAWLGVAMAMSTLQGLAALGGWHVLGLAPLHALSIGFFGSILLGMVSRVTLGHAGRQLAADRMTWSVFIGLEAVVLVRVLAEVVPTTWRPGLMLVAVTGWLAVFGLWALRYLPVYLRPRRDGKPG